MRRCSVTVELNVYCVTVILKRLTFDVQQTKPIHAHRHVIRVLSFSETRKLLCGTTASTVAEMVTRKALTRGRTDHFANIFLL